MRRFAFKMYLKPGCEKEYEITKVAVVDQFAHSTHVESVVALTRAICDDGIAKVD